MGDTDFIIEPGRQDIVIRRVFDAPRDVVFKAMTDPTLIPKWWGPRSLTTEVDLLESRPGGRWRLVHKEPDGTEYGFHGVHHDVVAPERVVRTFEFEGAPGHVTLETMTLEEVDGKTRLQTVSLYDSVETRDIVLQTGMESGARETLDRLAEVIESL